MKLSDAIQRMIAAGLSIDNALIAARCFEETQRSSGAERTRRWRENKAAKVEIAEGVTVTSQASQTSPGFSDKKEKSPAPSKEKTNSSPSSEPSVPRRLAPPSTKRTPRGELETVLTAEMAAAVLDHRTKFRKPLTLVAAEGLAKGFLATGDPDAAARMMIERAWIGFKSEWFFRDRDDGKRNYNQGRSGNRPSRAESFTTGFLGVQPERPDDRNGRGDDLRRSSSIRDAADEAFGTGRTIEGRAGAVIF